jgi:16S rRNA (cytosine1402-N4)-methyltransferase
MSGGYHTPVLLNEVIDGLAVRPDGIYVDATLGGGGYAEAIAMRLSSGIVIGFDTDPQAIRFASDRLAHFGSRVQIVQENFRKIGEALFEYKGKIDGIVYDLGISSRQIDTDSIGLSYRVSSPLDMRLDPRLRRSANDILHEASEDELKRIFKQYGEEPRAGYIARNIVNARKRKPIETTTELAEIVTYGIREDKKNAAASRIFQALRIEVNDELGALQTSLGSALDLITIGGRIAVVSYHSLEDRIVKEFYQQNAKPPAKSGTLESLRTTIDESAVRLRIITRKPVTASAVEIAANPRSRSAKLRIAEKCA